jgi:hypothetical protein
VTTDRETFDEQFSLVYRELRRLASGVLRQEQNCRLTLTKVLHEAWLKLAHSLVKMNPTRGEIVTPQDTRAALVEIVRRQGRRLTASAQDVCYSRLSTHLGRIRIGGPPLTGCGYYLQTHCRQVSPNVRKNPNNLQSNTRIGQSKGEFSGRPSRCAGDSLAPGSALGDSFRCAG